MIRSSHRYWTERKFVFDVQVIVPKFKVDLEVLFDYLGDLNGVARRRVAALASGGRRAGRRRHRRRRRRRWWRRSAAAALPAAAAAAAAAAAGAAAAAAPARRRGPSAARRRPVATLRRVFYFRKTKKKKNNKNRMRAVRIFERWTPKPNPEMSRGPPLHKGSTAPLGFPDLTKLAKLSLLPKKCLVSTRGPPPP